ncbi:hypothetical protein wHmcTK_02070 [Wolbachia pipientis]|nr:hypothetical protein wHmt_00930 [Wolbachia pipientis]BDG77117.1 hypothetical protein wHmc_02490 [Wolbachia pipientis]
MNSSPFKQYDRRLSGRTNPLILQERTISKKQRKNRKVTNINSIKFREEDLFVPQNAIEVENSNMSIQRSSRRNSKSDVQTWPN